MAKRYNAYELSEALSDLSNEEESDFSDCYSKYEPKDSDFDDYQLSSDSEQKENQDKILANKDNNVESNSDSSIVDPIINHVIWSNVAPEFQPRLNISQDRPCMIHPDITLSTRILDIFLKLFLYSLQLQIAYYTNKRLDMFQKAKKKKIAPTDAFEFMKLFGCFFIMSYNRLPFINHHWSNHISLGNSLMKSTFSRDRFKLIMSKLYVAESDKP